MKRHADRYRRVRRAIKQGASLTNAEARILLSRARQRDPWGVPFETFERRSLLRFARRYLIRQARRLV